MCICERLSLCYDPQCKKNARSKKIHGENNEINLMFDVGALFINLGNVKEI